MPHKKLLYPVIPASEVCVHTDAPILRGLEIINNSEARIAIVVDADERMVGSLVDGDIRRALLGGCKLESPVSAAMFTQPVSMSADSSRQQILDNMHTLQVKQMPLLTSSGKIAGIATFDMLTGFVRNPRSNPVVIMAGGKGKRLLPHTQDIPKPMVDVGGKPMLEHIINHFIKQGFSHFHLAINHLGHIIESYFGDGSRFHCSIQYIHELMPLGTAGALSLLKVDFEEPFIVINGDILTSVDFAALLDYHKSTDSTATVCARTHRVEVPFGVIEIKNGQMQAIVEKPVYEDLISAGIYVISPAALKHLSSGQAIDMPAFLQSLIRANLRVSVFPLHEEWADIGRPDDLVQAARSYKGASS